MTTKTEEKIKKLLGEHLVKQEEILNNKVGGIFLYGVIIGVIASYSGFLGYLAGVGSGVILSTKYNYVSTEISKKMVSAFDNLIKQINKNNII